MMRRNKLLLSIVMLFGIQSAVAADTVGGAAPIFNEMMRIDSQLKRSERFNDYYNTNALHQENARANDMSMTKYGKSFEVIEDIIKGCMERRIKMKLHGSAVNYSGKHAGELSKYSFADTLRFDEANWNWGVMQKFIHNEFIPKNEEDDMFHTKTRTLDEKIAFAVMQLVDYYSGFAEKNDRGDMRNKFIKQIKRATLDVKVYLKSCLYEHIKQVADDFTPNKRMLHKVHNDVAKSTTQHFCIERTIAHHQLVYEALKQILQQGDTTTDELQLETPQYVK